MSEKKQEIDKLAVLQALPSDVSRIQVVDTDGKTRFRLLDEVRWDDTLQFNGKGQPIVMRGSSGRPKADDKDPIPQVVGATKDPKVFVPFTRGGKSPKSFVLSPRPKTPTPPKQSAKR